MQFRTALLLAFAATSAHAQVDGPQTCNANPECAALQLADDCCPTNLAGIFLDCCEDKQASCAVNPGCAGLVDDCCPAADGSFLYCCFEEGQGDGGYKYDYTYFEHNDNGAKNVGNTWRYTGTQNFLIPGKVEYVRNADLVYDLYYIKGDVADANDYITGDKKFSLKLSDTTAPPCTQIILQFEHLDFDESGIYLTGDIPAYPTNRHSRYLATLPEDGSELIEFEFLDQPDDTVAAGDVNAVVIMFAPGIKTADQFTFSDLASSSKCDGGEGCVNSPVKSCPALYLTVEGLDGSMAVQGEVIVEEDPVEEAVQGEVIVEDNLTPVEEPTEGQDEKDPEDVVVVEEKGGARKRVLQAEPDCSDCANPACVGVDECAVDAGMDGLNEPQQPPAAEEGGSATAETVGEGSATAGDEPTEEPTEEEPTEPVAKPEMTEAGSEGETETPPATGQTNTNGDTSSTTGESAAGSHFGSAVVGTTALVLAFFGL